MKKTFSWIFGCIFALLAVFSLLNAHFISFLLEAFIAVLLIPPANKYLKEEIKVNIPKWGTPVAISLYIVFVIAMGSYNAYQAAAPFFQPFVRMSKEIKSYNRLPLEGVTAEQKESVEKYQTYIVEFMNKLKTLNQIKNEKIKKEKLIEYSTEIENLEIPKNLPEEVESLLIGSKKDFNNAFEMVLKMDDMNKDDVVNMLNKIVDGSIKVSKASILVGITPESVK